jgi:tetratricopeptide (TPR) repeat protein
MLNDNCGSIYYLSKGLALRNLNRIDQALQCYCKAIQIDPANRESIFFKKIDLFELNSYRMLKYK